ncbi:MAG: MATE family efflux transporter [Puniceicoccales bacterium]|jgi:MATE family multidrug resistance protein|nr:MATE family efflux transporter [Puniceicoccales bacterium]
MKSLTKFARGSIGELWAISWPLIITSAANMFMLVGDRVVLMHYSAADFNASLGALPWVWTAYFPLLTIVSIANVLVGRFNGTGEYGKIGPTVWQMIWFSLVLLVPVGIGGWYLAPVLLADSLRELGVPYLRILLPSVPISLVIFGALASFYTGRGKTRFVSIVSIASNLLNLVLDVILVFGIGPFPELGISGAAIGTVISQFVALVLFFVPFLAPKNNGEFRTYAIGLDGRLLRACLRIGTPNGFAGFINFALWSLITQVMATNVPPENFTAFGVSQSAFYCLLFIVEGISLGVGIIVSNAYGAGDWHGIEKNSRSWIRLSILIFAASFILMVAYPKPIMAIICRGTDSASFDGVLGTMMFLTWIAMAGESVTYNLRQILTAFGDTRYTMVVNILFYSGVVIVPSYFLLHATHNAASFLCAEAVSHVFMLSAYALRFRRWLKFKPLPKEI